MARWRIGTPRKNVCRLGTHAGTLKREKNIDIPISQLKQILDAELAIRNNQSLGGTSPAEVHRMIANFEEQLNAVALNI